MDKFYRNNLELQQIKRLSNIKEQLNDYNLPYYATGNTIKQFPTDVNRTPYPRFFRGVYNNENPIIFDREPGYTKIVPRPSYDNNEALITEPAPYFFEIPASVVLPPKNPNKWANKKFSMDTGCIYAGQI